MQKLKRFLKKAWTSFSLKFSLFRIWFMKNILVFLQILIMVGLVSVLTGAVKESTPVLGIILYPLFAPLVDEITTIIEEKQINDVMSFLSVAISLIVSFTVFTIKMKSIALSDIKSKKLKLAMVKANLYFNTNGKLVKKVEKATGKDLDGDGFIDETGEPIQNETIFSGIKRAASELITIVSVKVDDDNDEVNQEQYNKAIADANLEASAEAVKEIDEIIVNGTNQILKKKVEEKIYKSELEEISEEEQMDTVIKKSIFKRISEMVGKLFKKKEKEVEPGEEPESNIDVISTSDVAETPKKEVKKVKVVKQDTPMVKAPVVETKVVSEKKKDATDLFLNSLRKTVRK